MTEPIRRLRDYPADAPVLAELWKRAEPLPEIPALLVSSSTHFVRGLARTRRPSVHPTVWAATGMGIGLALAAAFGMAVLDSRRHERESIHAVGDEAPLRSDPPLPAQSLPSEPTAALDGGRDAGVSREDAGSMRRRNHSVEVSTPWERTAISTVFHQHPEELRACHASVSGEGYEWVWVRLTVDLRIQPNGRVERVSVGSRVSEDTNDVIDPWGTEDDPARPPRPRLQGTPTWVLTLQRCVESQVRGWRFPRAPTTTTISYPFSIGPGSRLSLSLPRTAEDIQVWRGPYE